MALSLANVFVMSENNLTLSFKTLDISAAAAFRMLACLSDSLSSASAIFNSVSPIENLSSAIFSSKSRVQAARPLMFFSRKSFSSLSSSW